MVSHTTFYQFEQQLMSDVNPIRARADHYGKTKFVGMEKMSEHSICEGVEKGHGIIINVHQGHHW
jgi:hypothetical protein